MALVYDAKLPSPSHCRNAINIRLSFRTYASKTHFKKSQTESFAIPSDQVSHDFTIETRNDQREVCPEHEENPMADQKTGFFTRPSRNHDAEKAEELV